jgi:hypothetical protein
MEGGKRTKVKYTHSGIHWETPLNINLNINNERQDCKVGIVYVCWGGTSEREEGEWRRLRWGYMVGGLHLLMWNRTKKPLAITLSGGGEGLRVRDEGGNVTNVQYKANWKCHYKYPHNEYILKKPASVPAHHRVWGWDRMIQLAISIMEKLRPTR